VSGNEVGVAVSWGVEVGEVINAVTADVIRVDFGEMGFGADEHPAEISIIVAPPMNCFSIDTECFLRITC
jgi:hypothetical protein